MYREWETKVNEAAAPFLEAEAKTSSHSASFYEGLGNNFLVMGKEPYAIWAYQKSLSLYPWNSSLKISLHTLQEKEGVPKVSNYMIPEAWLYQGFTLFFICLILLWKFKTAKIFFGGLTGLMLLLLAFSVWVMPTKGVIVKSTFLHQLPSSTSPIVVKNPLPSGIQIDVLSYEAEGKWLKIKDGEGNIGFIFYNSLRVI